MRKSFSFAAACLVLAWVGGPAAAEEPADARHRFLRDGNAGALASALAAETTEPGRTDAVLARMASEPSLQKADGGADGYGAFPEIVAALRRLELRTAEAALARTDGSQDALLGAWTGALVLARRGRDAEAIQKVLSAYERSGSEGPGPGDGGAVRRPDTSTFRLALFAAALPEDDRLVLVAVGHRALLAGAARSYSGSLVSDVARDLVAIDRTLGGECLALAARFHRRAGRADEATALLRGAEAERSNTSLVALERAVLSWVTGAPERGAEDLRAVAAEPWRAEVVDALRRGQGCDLLVGAKSAFAAPFVPTHAEGNARLSFLMARAATLAGVPTEPEDVAAHAASGEASPCTTVAKVLRSRGLTVLWLAGDARDAQALLEAGLPVVVFLPEPDGLARERPSDARAVAVLARGMSRKGGLLLLEEPDLRRLDVLPSSVLAKARFLTAVPASRAQVLAPWEGNLSATLGRLLADAEEASERGEHAQALKVLDSARATFDGVPPFDLCRALACLRAAAAVDPWDEAGVGAAREAVERSLATPPALPAEHVVRSRSLAWSREEDAASAALSSAEEAERLAGPSAAIGNWRFSLLLALRRHAAALKAAEQTWRLDPLDEGALYRRGGTRARMGDPQGARADFRRALDRRPDSRRVGVELAALEQSEGRPRAALDVLDDVAKAAPDTPPLEIERDLRRAAERSLLQRSSTVADLAGFRSSREPETRRHLAFALAQHETVDAEAVLRQLLDDPDRAVRVTTLRVYVRPWFLERVEQDEALGRKVRDLLRQDESAHVRAAAAALLKVIQRPFAEEALAARLAGPERDPDPYPRSAAAEALGRHGGPLGRRTLVAGLEDEDASVRRSSVDSLFRLASTDHGFDPDAPAPERAEAVARWKAWLAESGGR